MEREQPLSRGRSPRDSLRARVHEDGARQAARDGRFVSFTITDAHPKPGEFSLATQGVLTIGGLASSVTILHERVDGLACGLVHEWAQGKLAAAGKATSLERLTAGCKAVSMTLSHALRTKSRRSSRGRPYTGWASA